jgi:hypothetical protein
MDPTSGMLVATLAPVAAAAVLMRALRVGSADGFGTVWVDTQQAFDNARARHRRWMLLMRVTGRRCAVSLRRLDTANLHVGRHLGQCEVALDRIVGTAGGRHLFDARFDPTASGAWPRYSAVFAARSSGADLPPVALYRAPDGGYYVVDGHHRVAVARALHDPGIWADVTVLDPQISAPGAPTT